jgi:predicted naringenin-chalcone synthase
LQYFSFGILFRFLNLFMVSLLAILEQRAIACFAPAFWSIEVVVIARLVTYVTLHVATAGFGTSHLVTAGLFYEGCITLVAIADKSFRHGLFHLSPDVTLLFQRCLLTSLGDMSFQVAETTTCDHAVELSAPKFLVNSHWRVLFCIGTEGALGKIRQPGQSKVLVLLNSIKSRSQ